MRSGRLWGTAETLGESIGVAVTPIEQHYYRPYIAAARTQLDEAAFDAAISEGREMSPEQAVEYALGAEEPAKPETSKEPPGIPIHEALADGLTCREREVALLATRGLTNRRIAGELSISEHTVANHVRNVLKKLGLRSRAQISSRLQPEKL